MVAPSVDLLALLRPTQVTVTVAGHPFVLQATIASHWLGAIALDPENLQGIMPGLVGDDDMDMMLELMHIHPDMGRRWTNAARTALGRGGGRDWWWALNLSRKALGAWIYVNGLALQHNIDSKAMSYPDWLDACYVMLWTRGDENERTKLDMQLSMRPRGVGVRMSKAAQQAMISDFMSD